MAEAASDDLKAPQTKKDKGDLECAVCLQNCVHPAQLPCGHIFCFLCVKGFANQSKKCAMCRQEIPRDFIDQPHLLQSINQDVPDTFEGGYQWFYEGRNGWWQYDERTSKELETSYKKGDKTIEQLIAGSLYIVDFENMYQLRRSDPSRRRKIKRDRATVPKKGIAGLRIHDSDLIHVDEESRRPGSPLDGSNDNMIVPVTPSNTPQTPISGRESPHQQEEEDLQATVERISSLWIRDDADQDEEEEDERPPIRQRSFRNRYHRHTNED